MDGLGHHPGAVVIPQRLAPCFGLERAAGCASCAPNIGGGFGPKMMMFYPEEVLIPWAALRLGRPVKWIEDRLEHFTATTHERSQIHDAELAVDAEGRILGLRDVFLHDTGAYDPYGLTVPINSQCTVLGCYVVPAYESTFTAVFTNRTLVTPYRGAGRQHGVFVMERLLDIAARELGLDRAEIRRRNFIPPTPFPFDQGVIYQDFSRLHYDSGNYEPSSTRRWTRSATPTSPPRSSEGARRGPRARPRPRLLCRGTGIGPYEGARVQVQASGKVTLATGIGSQGQGHATAFAQVVGRAARRRHPRRGGHDRRHRPVPVGGRHLRQPRRRRRRQRDA
jgi:CO/xanthine dehydrogenase Mo-binding subunit